MQTLTTYKTSASTDRAAIIRIMTAMNELGWSVTSYHDSEVRSPLLNASPELVADKVAETNIATVDIVKGEHKAGLFFIMQGEPDCVLADSSYYDFFNADWDKAEKAANLDGCN